MPMDYHGSEAYQVEEKRKEQDVPSLGFAIYRCTYEDDADWERFMLCLQAQARRSLKFYNALHLESNLDWVVFSDKSLDGASIEQVHERFKAWAGEQIKRYGVWEYCHSPRYNFCVQVDKDCLQSVLHPTNPHPEQGIDVDNSYVNIIEARRYIEPAEPASHMRVSLFIIFPGVYHMLDSPGGWDIYYIEPPGILDG